MDHCLRCGEELSEYTSCACAFTPHYPRASSSSASSSAPRSMRALLESSGRASPNLPILTPAQRGTLARLAAGPTHVHGATAARLLLFGFVRPFARASGSAMRPTYEITPKGLEAHRALSETTSLAPRVPSSVR